MRDLTHSDLEQVSGGVIDPRHGTDTTIPSVPPTTLDPPPFNPHDFDLW